MMTFTFEVKFNQNGELLTVRPEGEEKPVSFEEFHPEYEPLEKHSKSGILTQAIPIDLKLLVLNGDDPCITHKGRRY